MPPTSSGSAASSPSWATITALNCRTGRVIPGIQSIEKQRWRLAQFPIPQDLRGKRVLDIGAWDGWFSFEMERRGAQVVAVDATKRTRFLEAKAMLNSKVEHVVADICFLTPRDIGTFDIVLFFGVLYHLKHPMLALERVCELSTDLACVESFVTDDQPSAPVPVDGILRRHAARRPVR